MGKVKESWMPSDEAMAEEYYDAHSRHGSRNEANRAVARLAIEHYRAQLVASSGVDVVALAASVIKKAVSRISAQVSTEMAIARAERDGRATEAQGSQRVERPAFVYDEDEVQASPQASTTDMNCARCGAAMKRLCAECLPLCFLPTPEPAREGDAAKEIKSKAHDEWERRYRELLDSYCQKFGEECRDTLKEK